MCVAEWLWKRWNKVHAERMDTWKQWMRMQESENDRIWLRWVTESKAR